MISLTGKWMNKTAYCKTSNGCKKAKRRARMRDKKQSNKEPLKKGNKETASRTEQLMTALIEQPAQENAGKREGE